MPNRWTRVPQRPPPSLPGWARMMVPVADLFMLAMVSRPSSGSLRSTWVTPATAWLCLAVVGGALVVAAVCAGGLGHGGGWVPGLGLVGCAAAVAGAGAVGVVAIAQRRA